MMRVFHISLLFTLSSATLLFGQEPSSGEQLYQKNCAACHGAKLEGGQARSLVDAVWQFGSGRSAILRNIKHGISDFAMPAFEAALSDKQMNQIIDFLLAAEKKSGITKPPPPERISTLDYEIRVQKWVTNLDSPWAIDFVDNRRALVTEKTGHVRVIIDGILQPEPIRGTPEVLNEGQGGLLDVAVDPEYAKNGWIYLAYSHALPAATAKARPMAMTRLVRGRVSDNAWIDQQVVYEAPHELYLETRHHYGCRIVFDRNGFLYFSIGERGHGEHAQTLSRPNGKIHRIQRDGSIPKDNPFIGRKDALATIFSYGNRNPQGLAVHPQTDQVWETEHGPMGGDELNLISAGANYGWPVVTYGRNYDGAKISDDREKAGIETPVLYWNPSIAVCGIDFVRSELFPRWRNRLLVTALKFEEVRLVNIAKDRVLHQEIILKNSGRVRDVASGPDGAIYVVLNGPDMILRLTPIRDVNLSLEESGN
jgi:aldose sugar dehydrogenase